MPRRPNPWYRTAEDAWYVKLHGRQHRLSEGRGGEEAAWRAFHRLMALEGRVEPRSDLSVAEALDHWLDHSLATHKPATWACNRARAQVVANAIGGVPVAQLKVGQVERFLAGRDRSQATKRAYVVTLRAAIKLCRRDGLLPRDCDPIAELKAPAMTRRERTLSAEERARLFEAAPPEFRRVLVILNDTGCRPHVACDLEARHVDLEAGVAVVPSKGRPYRLQLVGRARELVEQLVAEHPTGPLLRNSRGERWTRNAVRLAMRTLSTRAGVSPPVAAYVFRHSLITDALEAGVPASHVAELVNHTDLTMISRHYSKLSERRGVLRQAAEDAARAAGPRAEPTPSRPGTPRAGRRKP